MDIGVMGLGVMGENLILNIEEKGYTVSIFNRTAEKTKCFYAKHSSRNIKEFYDLESFVCSLDSPRKILLMITAGEAIDAVISSLMPLIDPEDIIIDGGNSFFEDTEKRCEMYKEKLLFLGCGISGGEVGARSGPSMMFGGDFSAWKGVSELFGKISARAGDRVCCAYLGKGGAGHFIKMVHNGIEYCEMEFLAEIYVLLRKSGLGNRDVGDVFASWLNNGFLKGYLIEICIDILKRSDNIIDLVEDIASQKGTGIQCVMTALKSRTPATVMCDSVLARIVSSKKEERKAFSARIKACTANEKADLKSLEKALIMAKSVAYVQGFNLIVESGKKYGWEFNLKEVCDIWKSGCILRGSFLNVVEKMVQERENNFELSSPFIMIYNENYESLKKVVKQGVDFEAPASSFSSSLFYINGLKTRRGGGCLIQAMRDYFGGHTVRIEGKEENVHIDWCN